MRKLLLAVVSLSLGTAAPAFAADKGGAKKGNVLLQMAADYLHHPQRDLAVIATAVPYTTDNVQGAAALVRVADGSDGGNPTCHLLQLEGRAGAPGKILSELQFSVCPRYDKDQKQGGLERVNLSSKWGAWRVHLFSQRMDSMAKGVETSVLWGMAADLGDGQLKLVFERTSTTFKSQEDKKLNQSEVCQQPILRVGADPEGLTIVCDSETMLGNLPKKLKSTLDYTWQGDRYLPK